MILADAGPLVAIIDVDEANHLRCVAALDRVTLPLVTTWAAFAEAMYLLGRVGGWRGQERLWRLVTRGDLELADISSSARAKTAELMATYRDLPMDLADATLVAVAEERGLSRIFSLDRDFHVYRMANGKAFTVIP